MFGIFENFYVLTNIHLNGFVKINLREREREREHKSFQNECIEKMVIFWIKFLSICVKVVFVGIMHVRCSYENKKMVRSCQEM